MSGASDLDVAMLLDMRSHLSIVHHMPGRIRLRLRPAMWGTASQVNRNVVRQIISQLEGVRDVRVNAAVASVVIEYDPKQVRPEQWETLVRGDAEAAGLVLNQWLARYGQLLQNPLKEKE
jgi:hypothetical protein